MQARIFSDGQTLADLLLHKRTTPATRADIGPARAIAPRPPQQAASSIFAVR